MFDAGCFDDREVVEQFRVRELERRRREVELALLVGEVDVRNLYEGDGMRTAQSWCRGSARWTNGEARDACQVARLLRVHADIVSVDDAVRLPVGHLREIARVAANPRCARELPRVMSTLLFWGDTLDHAAFRTVVRRFESLADADGTGRGHEESHERRRMSIVPGEVGAHVHGYLGSLQAAIVSEIFERFCQSELEADWVWVREHHGEDGTAAMMPRTAAQRRADAFFAMVMQAASTPPGSTPPEPLVFVTDYQTLHDTARRRCQNTRTDSTRPAHPDTDTAAAEFGADDVDDVEMDDLDVDLDDVDLDDVDLDDVDLDDVDAVGNDPRRRRCESGEFTLDPDDILTAAVLGRIRAVVVDRAGIAVKIGRKSRLFTGPLRATMLALGGRCSCRGCSIRRRLEIDHIIDWQHHGNTDSDNGDPRCRWHHALKNKGFRTWRDSDGIWHHYRPDGTEITCI